MDFVYSLIIAFVGMAISFIVARKYGDVAGTKAAIEHEKKKDEKSHQIATYALLNQIKVAKAIAEQQKFLCIDYVGSPAIKMPVTPFETAFLIGKDSFMAVDEYSDNDVIQDNLDIVSRYLVNAYSINASVDIYIHVRPERGSQYISDRQLAMETIGSLSKEAIEILNELEKALKVHLP